jgi:sec-independent protein translocase protein TatA
MIEGLFAPMHLLIIGSIALLVFGPSRLPELGRGFGQAIRSFKAGLEEIGAPHPHAPPELAAEAQAPVDPAPRIVTQGAALVAPAEALQVTLEPAPISAAPTAH